MHHRLHTAEAVLRLLQAPHETDRHLVGAAVDHRLEEGLLRRVPVEDRLLADAQLPGEVIEGGAVVAAGPEGVHGGAEDAIGGR